MSRGPAEVREQALEQTRVGTVLRIVLDGPPGPPVLDRLSHPFGHLCEVDRFGLGDEFACPGEFEPVADEPPPGCVTRRPTTGPGFENRDVNRDMYV